jgi:hypothetical protein
MLSPVFDVTHFYGKCLKEKCREIFDSILCIFFPWSPIILLAHFRIFSITCEGIRNAGCTTCDSDSVVKRQNVLTTTGNGLFIFMFDTVDYGYQISD